jgi:hypothetical protein
VVLTKKTKVEYLQMAVRQKQNFFATVITEFHLVGVLSYAEKLITEGIKVRGFICIKEHPINGYLIEEAFLERYNLHLVQVAQKSVDMHNVSYTNILYGLYKHTIKKERFYCISVLNPDFMLIKSYLVDQQMDKALKVVLVDEGSGTYMPESYWDFVNFLEGRSPKRRITMKRTRKMIRNLCIFPFFSVEKYWLFKKGKGGRLQKNIPVLEQYKVFYLKYYEIINADYKKIKKLIQYRGKEKGIALYFSQPLSALHLFDIDEEIKMLYELKRRLYNQNIDLLIKLHPRDPYDKYKLSGIESIDMHASAEVLASVLMPKYVFGISSTALSTVSAIFNIPAYGLDALVKKKHDIPDETIQGLNHFKRLYQTMICFPNSFTALQGYLNDA